MSLHRHSQYSQLHEPSSPSSPSTPTSQTFPTSPVSPISQHRTASTSQHRTASVSQHRTASISQQRTASISQHQPPSHAIPRKPLPPQLHAALSSHPPPEQIPFLRPSDASPSSHPPPEQIPFLRPSDASPYLGPSPVASPDLQWDSAPSQQPWRSSEGRHSFHVYRPPEFGLPPELKTERPQQNDELISTHNGLNIYLRIAASWCINFATWGLATSSGVFQAHYRFILLPNSSSAAIAFIGSLQLALFVGGEFFAGPLLEKGHVRSLLVAGSGLLVIGMMMTSLCGAYWQFVLAQGLCTGVAMGCLGVAGLGVGGEWDERKGAVRGIVRTGGPVGAIIFAIVFEELTPRIGFGWAVRVVGFLLLAVLILPMLVVKRKVSKSAARTLLDVGDTKDVPVIVFMVALILGFMGAYIPYFYLEQFSIAKQIFQGSHARLHRYLIAILNTGSFFGQLTLGALVDKAGPLNIWIPCSAITGIIAFAWISVRSEGDLIAFALFYGFFSAAFMSLTFGSLTSISPDTKALGKHAGIMALCMAVGILSGPSIAGTLISNGSTDFVRLRVFGGSLVLEATVFLVGCRIAVRGVKWLVKV